MNSSTQSNKRSGLNTLLQAGAIAAALTLTTVTTAKAADLTPQAQGNSRLANPSVLLLAEDSGPTSDTFPLSWITMMMRHHLQLAETAQQGLRSSDPEVRKMAQEILSSSNAMMAKLMAMHERMIINLMRS